MISNNPNGYQRIRQAFENRDTVTIKEIIDGPLKTNN
jgi:hypothetical protein